jgi:hypothetical protein
MKEIKTEQTGLKEVIPVRDCIDVMQQAAEESLTEANNEGMAVFFTSAVTYLKELEVFRRIYFNEE